MFVIWVNDNKKTKRIWLINSICLHTQFTIEVEKEDKIAFLDVLVPFKEYGL